MHDEPGACPRCERLPEDIGLAGGVLYLRVPLSHSLGRLLRDLGDARVPFRRHDGLLTIAVEAGALGELGPQLGGLLSSTERRDTRVVFQPTGTALRLADCFDSESLEQFLGRLGARWLTALMREDRLTSLFQPIVHCAAPGRVFAYECLLRGRERDGTLIGPARIFDAARSAELLFQVDLLGRRTAIREAAAAGLAQADSKVFINFTPTSIYDPTFCLQSTARAIADVGLRPSQIVFEVIESEHVADLQHLRRILDFYRAEGFGVALDDLGAGYSSLNMLSELRPDYVKLDMGLLRNVHADPVRAMVASKILELARDLGIRSIGEGIETVEEFDWLAQAGADYAQGYLFARPANPPPLPLDRPAR